MHDDFSVNVRSSRSGIRKRYFFVYIIAVILFLPIYYRLFNLQVADRDRLLRLADKQHNIVVELLPKRGGIVDRNQKELATSLKTPSIYAIPRMILNKKKLAQQLAPILEKDESMLLKRLNRDKSFVWLRRNVDSETARKIEDLKNPNVAILHENHRFYPQNEMLSHVIGFCDIDNNGLEGIELLCDEYLAGREGYLYTKRDARGRRLTALADKVVPAIDGNTTILTVDQVIQHIVERELDAAYIQWKAKGAMAVVMDCHSGQILAIASRPGYNLNKFSSAPEATRRNRAITDFFEPGSIFKIVTATAALNEKAFAMDDTIFCENGEYYFSARRVLHDVHPYGELEFPMVIIKSSNIGVAKIAQALGEERLYDYITRFGFGQKTQVDMPGEVAGIMRHPRYWSKISITSLPMGQEITVTALQMVSAISVIANGGHLMRPYIIDSIVDNEGVAIIKNNPEVRRTIVDSTVTEKMREILTRVVDEGTGKRAQIEGMKVAGKTGTAQKILENGRGYSHSNFMSSFVGFAPADNPQISVIVVLDDPKPLYYGGTVSAPVFKNIVEKTLHYLGYNNA